MVIEFGLLVLLSILILWVYFTQMATFAWVDAQTILYAILICPFIIGYMLAPITGLISTINFIITPEKAKYGLVIILSAVAMLFSGLGIKLLSGYLTRL